MAIPVIIVHGGAATVDEGRREVCIAGCEQAARAGFAILAQGGSALDACEAAVRVLEDDPEFNAGYGSVLTRQGHVEVDAAMMDGDLRAGAVGAVPWLRHPVSVARRLLEVGEHVLLVAGGALDFAREQGFFGEPPHAMISEGSRARFESGHKKSESADTVGACALDAQGRVASATSTGGIAGKRCGRVGDSPIVGAGLYADSTLGAAAATGHGESILRVVMSKFAIDRLRQDSAQAAAEAAIREMLRRTGGEGGIILIDKQGRTGHYCSTPRMPWAVQSSAGVHSGVENS